MGERRRRHGQTQSAPSDPVADDDPGDGRRLEHRAILARSAASRPRSGRPLCTVVARNREADCQNETIGCSRSTARTSTSCGSSRSTPATVCRRATAQASRASTSAGAASSRRATTRISARRSARSAASARRTSSTAATPIRTSRVGCADDVETKSISWPNYHSGSNGDFQRITPVGPVHELLTRCAGTAGVIA